MSAPTVTVPIEVPRVPNFVRLMGGGTVGVEHLTEDQLRELGAAWTEALVKNAALRRAYPVGASSVSVLEREDR